jgi:hypothetical protein
MNISQNEIPKDGLSASTLAPALAKRGKRGKSNNSAESAYIWSGNKKTGLRSYKSGYKVIAIEDVTARRGSHPDGFLRPA